MAEAVEVVEVKPDDLPGSAGAAARGEKPTKQDITSLVGGGPDPALDVKGVTDDLSRITREEIGARGQILSGMFGRSEADLARARQAFEAEGVGPSELKSWNAAEESRKHEYDPVEAFGSVGSVFATIASAFTRRPMINALNASAAAMEATREAKKEDFTRAYQAWKDNNELVIKRHNMMHQQYQDAIGLMQTDMQLGSAKLSALAAQFGDQKTLALLDHGMSKELFEMLDARARATDRLAEVNEKALERTRKNFDLNERLQAEGVTKKDIPRIVREWHRDWETQGYRSTEDQLLQDFRRDWAAAHEGKPPPAEEEAKFLQTVPHGRVGTGAGANTNLTSDRQRAADVAKARERWKAEGKSDAEIAELAAKLEAKLKTESASVTGNRREQLEAHIAQYDNAVAAIDKVTNVLERYVGAAGIAGRLTRTGERIENIFGNKQTDRVQFMRDVEYIKALAPNLLLDRSGRPLSAEAAHINDIVAGLSAGDTTANTMRAMKDLKTLLRKMQADQKKRIGEESPEPSTLPSATPDSGDSKNWYEHYQ